MPNNLWQPGQSGNLAGRTRGSRNKLTEAVVCALLRDFSRHGEKAIARVRQTQPGVYLKVLALLIPKQDKLEHSNTIKEMSDEELEGSIAILKAMMTTQAFGSAHLIEGKAELVALPEPAAATAHAPKPKNRLMLEADTAVGPRERTPRKMRPPPGE